MGEGGTIGAPAAVLGAINDALSGTGTRFDHIPVRPEHVSAALNRQDVAMKDMHAITLRVNGRDHELVVEARRTLADMLRHDLGYTGTHLGCEHGICGACTVLVDDAPVRACLVFGVQADGAEVAHGRRAWPTARSCPTCSRPSATTTRCSAASARPASSCSPRPTSPNSGDRAGADRGTEIRELVAANLCRCTGYQGIVEAVLATAASPRRTPTD